MADDSREHGAEGASLEAVVDDTSTGLSATVPTPGAVSRLGTGIASASGRTLKELRRAGRAPASGALSRTGTLAGELGSTGLGSTFGGSTGLGSSSSSSSSNNSRTVGFSLPSINTKAGVSSASSSAETPRRLPPRSLNPQQAEGEGRRSGGAASGATWTGQQQEEEEEVDQAVAAQHALTSIAAFQRQLLPGGLPATQNSLSYFSAVSTGDAVGAAAPAHPSSSAALSSLSASTYLPSASARDDASVVQFPALQVPAVYEESMQSGAFKKVSSGSGGTGGGWFGRGGAGGAGSRRGGSSAAAAEKEAEEAEESDLESIPSDTQLSGSIQTLLKSACGLAQSLLAGVSVGVVVFSAAYSQDAALARSLASFLPQLRILVFVLGVLSWLGAAHAVWKVQLAKAALIADQLARQQLLQEGSLSQQLDVLAQQQGQGRQQGQGAAIISRSRMESQLRSEQQLLQLLQHQQVQQMLPLTISTELTAQLALASYTVVVISILASLPADLYLRLAGNFLLNGIPLSPSPSRALSLMSLDTASLLWRSMNFLRLAAALVGFLSIYSLQLLPSDVDALLNNRVGSALVSAVRAASAAWRGQAAVAVAAQEAAVAAATAGAGGGGMLRQQGASGGGISGGTGQLRISLAH